MAPVQAKKKAMRSRRPAAAASSRKPPRLAAAKSLSKTQKKPLRVEKGVCKTSASKQLAIDGVPPAVVVNLRRRTDRWSNVSKRLTRLRGVDGSRLDFARFEAVDGAAGAVIPSDEVATSWSTARNWKYVVRSFEGGEECGYTSKELPLSGGERGCAASHIAVWRRCEAKSRGPMLVLEDDAIPKPSFMQTLQEALVELADESPDILYLGYTQAAPWRRKIGPVVREAEYLWTTVAYVLWPQGARKLLAALPVDQPVDNYMAALIAAKKLRGFAVKPVIVAQEGKWNVGNDIKHSDDAAWIQNSTAA